MKKRARFKIRKKSRTNFFRSTRRTFRKSIKKTFLWTLALAFVPVIWAAGKTLILMAPSVASEGFSAWWIYLSGAVVFLVSERWVHKPMWLYVVGHELTHAATGLLSGAKIHSIEATSDGGEVRLSKSNGFVALSPYIIPFYSLVVIGLYALLKNWIPDPNFSRVFQFLLGFTLAFHASFTWQSIHGHQSDLKVMGFFFSGAAILLGNLLILGFFFVGLFKSTPDLKSYAHLLGRESLSALVWTWHKTGDTVRFIQAQRNGAFQP